MEKVVVYRNGDKYYLRGFDYAEVYHVEMGIDSKIHYYEVDINELKTHLANALLKYQNMTHEEKALIAQEFFTEKEDRLNRIKKATDYQLYEWRIQVMRGINDGYADISLLNDIDKEIERRKKYQETHGNLRKDLLGPLKVIADELKRDNFNKDLIGEQIEELKRIYDLSLEKDGSKRY